MLEKCISAVSGSDIGWTLAASLQLTVVVISHSQQFRICIFLPNLLQFIIHQPFSTNDIFCNTAILINSPQN